MKPERPELRALAERLGIASSYWDLEGGAHPTSDATREALVAAFGLDGSSEAAAAGARRACEEAEAAQLIDPVVVWREYAEAPPRLTVQLPASAVPLDYRLELGLEDGSRHEAHARVEAGAARRVALDLPALPPFGYHEIRLALEAPGGPREAVQRLVMAPRTAFGVEAKLGGPRAFGIWTSLYTVRSRRNWGFGDFGDLGELLRLVARAGGAFVGVNPLHAVPNRGLAFTPYSPSSRLYRNALYLDVEAVPELAVCDAARARLADSAFRRRLGRLRRAASIDHEAVLEAKLAVLRELHRSFPAAGPRAALYREYCAREGEELAHFATWEVLADHFSAGAGRDWRRWPAPYRDPGSAAVAAFRAEHAEEVAFRAWLQFEADAQLARIAALGGELSLAIGTYHDLAVGVAPDSADAWMDQSLFARGVAVGAPPDDYAPEGQNWGFQPLDPRRLRERGYRSWSRLLHASFAHAGALRVDHAMGLARLFWIPEGRPCSEGTYVYQRSEDLLGILALESHRHRAVAIAEDLGTVPEGFRELLADWGVLSSAVLYFEREQGGRLRPPAAWSPRTLATVETHDLVPLAGHAAGVDLVLRRRAGAIADDASLARALAARALEHEAILARLREEALLPAAGEPDPSELCAAVHAFLARTPVCLAAASLDDLAREREPVNLPGVPVERHRSWSRRMRVRLEELAADPAAARALAALAGGPEPTRSGGAPARLPALDGRSDHRG